MKKKDVLFGGVVGAIILTLSCVFGRIFSNMAVKLADLFVVLDFYSASWVRAVTLLVFSLFFAGFISYKWGYRNVQFAMPDSMFSWGLGTIFHFVLSLITLFSPWVAGATKHIGGLVSFGDNYTYAEKMRDIPFLTLCSIGVITAVLYAADMLLFEKLGSEKRLKDREKLMSENK